MFILFLIFNSMVPIGTATQNISLHRALLEGLTAKKSYDDPSSPFNQRGRMPSQNSSASHANVEPSGRNSECVHTTGAQQRKSSQETSASVFYFPNDPIKRCSSPDMIIECDGWCRKRMHCYERQSRVVHCFYYITRYDLLILLKISIAACKDSQSAWEDPEGKSLTQVCWITSNHCETDLKGCINFYRRLPRSSVSFDVLFPLRYV
jgi:hypothetical protein